MACFLHSSIPSFFSFLYEATHCPSHEPPPTCAHYRTLSETSTGPPPDSSCTPFRLNFLLYVTEMEGWLLESWVNSWNLPLCPKILNNTIKGWHLVCQLWLYLNFRHNSQKKLLVTHHYWQPQFSVMVTSVTIQTNDQKIFYILIKDPCYPMGDKPD